MTNNGEEKRKSGRYRFILTKYILSKEDSTYSNIMKKIRKRNRNYINK